MEEYALIIDEEIEKFFKTTSSEALKKYFKEMEANEADNLHFSIRLVRVETLQDYRLKNKEETKWKKYRLVEEWNGI